MAKFLNMFSKKPRVSVLRLEGAIGVGGRLGGASLNDAGIAALMQKAFTRGKPKAVALAINSPGGSPAQSALIGARIRRLSEENNIPVIAFVEDVAASGGYWLASAADEIFVDKNSIVGSIGVIYAAFGFTEAIEKLGIERRVHTAGKNKLSNDPFQAEKPADVKRLKELQLKIHENFIEQVEDRRGAKLADKDLFTGDIWIGQDAIDVGLADGIGHLVPVMKERFGDKVKFQVMEQKKSFFSRLGLGSALSIAASVEERALWARFGL